MEIEKNQTFPMSACTLLASEMVSEEIQHTGRAADPSEGLWGIAAALLRALNDVGSVVMRLDSLGRNNL